MPRVNIKITDDMKSYFEELSKKYGISQSSLMVMYLQDQIDTKKAVNSIPDLLKLQNELSAALPSK